MADPCFDQTLVCSSCLLKSDLLRGVIVNHEETLSTFRRSHHMDDSFIALVPQLDRRPPRLIKDSLPYIFIDVGLPIHDSTVDQNNRVRLLHLSNIDENLLQVHLQLHENLLELDGLCESHCVGVNWHASLFENHCGFRHLKHSEAHLGQNQREF